MKDYSKGKIYKIVCNITGLIYIGSTCEPTLARRLANHVGRYRCWVNGKKIFMTSFKIIEGENYDIILVEECPCESKDQLHARERHYIETVNCVNKVIPTRSQKEYYENNIEKIQLYYLDNKDRIQEYRETNKEKIKAHKGQTLICSCGLTFTRCNKSHHEKSKRHQAYVNSEEV